MYVNDGTASFNSKQANFAVLIKIQDENAGSLYLWNQKEPKSMLSLLQNLSLRLRLLPCEK